jgi:hypothetical protein
MQKGPAQPGHDKSQKTKAFANGGTKGTDLRAQHCQTVARMVVGATADGCARFRHGGLDRCQQNKLRRACPGQAHAVPCCFHPGLESSDLPGSGSIKRRDAGQIQPRRSGQRVKIALIVAQAGQCNRTTQACRLRGDVSTLSRRPGCHSTHSAALSRSGSTG